MAIFGKTNTDVSVNSLLNNILDGRFCRWRIFYCVHGLLPAAVYRLRVSCLSAHLSYSGGLREAAD